MALSMSRPAYDNILQRDQAASIGEYTDNKSFPMTSESHKRRAHDRDEGDLVDLSDATKDNQALSSDTEMDSEPAAKVQRGGGRRKQSKPLRMCASAEPANDMEPVEMKLEPTPSAFSDSLHCDLCNEFCANERSLKDHIRLAHGPSQSETTTDGRPVPTKYHQLGQELGQELYSQSVADDVSKNKQIGSSDGRYERPISAFEKELIAKTEHGWERYDREDGEKCREDRKSSRESPENAEKNSVTPDSKIFNAEALQPGSSSSFLGRSGVEESGGNRRPSDPNNQEGEAGRVIWDPNGKGRIFHPDAYCEICDREFCNKYFLKTHKANKHGIYDTSLAVPELPGGGMNNMFSIMNLLQHQQQQQQQQFQQQQQDFSMSARNLLFPPLLPKLTSASAKPPEKMVSTSPNAMLSAAMKGSDDPYESSPSNALDKEDYCDFCQKHFCNKYYLRKHKLDVHGLGSGAPASTIPFSSSQDNNNAKRSSSSGAFSSAGNNGLDATSSAIATLGMSRVSGPTTSSSASSVPPGPMPYLHNMANLMFLNPFAIIPPLFQTTGGMPTYGGGSSGLAFPPGLINSDGEVKNLSAGSNGPSSMAAGASPLDASMSGIQHNILQSLGMNNAEAYLEMCRKEISKSYLMRNATPESSSSKRNLFSGEFAGFGGETSGSGSRPMIKTEPSGEKPLSDLCDVYKKTFSSLSSLQGGKWDGLNNSLAEELTRLEKFNGVGGVNDHFDKSIFNNMVAAKLIDRVLCDICNKEVCNKYFLKTHKIKVHGWDPGTSDFEAAQDASSTTPIKRQSSPPPLMPISFQSKDVIGFDQLREEELVKMGIDPEAYCDICKKEFCSKYFLKTHRQNIHGIKPDGLRMPDGSNCVVSASPGGGSNNFGLPMDYSSASMLPASSSGATFVSTSHLSGASQLNIFAGMNHQINSSIYNNSLQLQTSLGAATAVDSGSRSGSEKRTSGFKWKEPGNASRVMCDICNKDLCNKYFLKTHMLKCHGINFDTVTGLRTNDASSMSLPFFNNEGGNDSSDDGASGHSGNPSSSRGDGPGQGSSSLQRLPWENGLGGGGSDDKPHRTNYDGERRKCQSPMNLVLTESNHVESKFRAISEENIVRRASGSTRGSLNRNGSSSNEDASGGDSSQPDENSPAGSPPILIARDSQRCRESSSFAARQSTQQSSELNADKTRARVDENGPKLSQSNCDKSSGVSSEAATKAAIANHIRNQQNRKMFCCALCQERFASRLECDIHTAKEHSQSSRGFNYASTNFGDASENNGRFTSSKATHDSAAANNEVTDSSCHRGVNLISPSLSIAATTNNTSDPAVSLFGSNAGSMTSSGTATTSSSNTAWSVSPPTTTTKPGTTYAQPTEPPFDRSKIPMQLFNLCEETEGGRHFLPSVVCLPTLCPVTEPMSVTFTLTPVSQP